MTDLDWDILIPLAEKVASDIAAKWPVVEADDVQQEIVTHVLEEKAAIARYQGDEDLIRRIFYNAGRRYASKERAYRDLMDDQYYYTPDEVQGVMRSFLYTDDEISEQIGRKDDLTRCVISDNIISARVDASTSLNKINSGYRDLIMRLYVYGLPPKDQAERRRGGRAIDALTLQMNRNARTNGNSA